MLMWNILPVSFWVGVYFMLRTALDCSYGKPCSQTGSRMLKTTLKSLNMNTSEGSSFHCPFQGPLADHLCVSTSQPFSFPKLLYKMLVFLILNAFWHWQIEIAIITGLQGLGKVKNN